MGSSAQVTLAFLAKDLASGTIRGLSKTLGGLGGVAGKVGSTIATGLKVGVAAITGLTAAAVGLGVAFAKAAVEDEKNQRLLVDALKARGLATEANIAATDKLIAKGAALAFTDDQIRAGLSTATQFTKNFADAQKILAAAQNIARAKGIGLAEATQLVGKAYAGNGKAAKQLGVDLSRTITVTNQKIKTDKKGLKTITETNKQVKTQIKGLAAVNLLNKQFAGAAAGYADTTQGRFESLQITLSELGESIGYTLLPVVNELLGVFRDYAVPIIESVVGSVQNFIEANKGMITGAIEAAGALAGKILPVLGNVADFVFTKVIPAVSGFITKLVEPGGVADSVGKVVGPIMQNLLPALGKIFDSMGRLIGKISEIVGQLWGGGSGPLAVAVKAIGGLFGYLATGISKTIDQITAAITTIQKLVNAIVNSPFYGLFKSILNTYNPFAGMNLPTSVPGGVAPSSYDRGAATATIPTINANTYLDGKIVASSVNKYLGNAAVVAGTTRTGAR